MLLITGYVLTKNVQVHSGGGELWCNVHFALCQCTHSNSCNSGCSLRGASKLWCTGGDSAVHHEVEGGVRCARKQAAVQVHQGMQECASAPGGARGIGV